MSTSSLLPFQPSSMSSAQLAAVSYLARYSGRTHELYAYQLRRWFDWCQSNGLDPLIGIQRAHVELYIRQLGESGLMVSSVTTMMHGVRGFFRFAHIDGLIPTLMVNTATPIDAEYTDVRFAYTVKTGGDARKARLAAAIIADLKRQFEQDLPIWENKRCWDRPVLCDGDGPIATYRRWYAQFVGSGAAS